MQKIKWMGLIFLLLVLNAPSWGYDQSRQPREPRQRPTRQPRQRPQRDQVLSQQTQLSEEARAGFQEVQDALKDILTAVNQNQTPETAPIEKARQTLEDNKRYARDYPEAEQADYMLLQAWCDYYGGDLEAAMRWALRAAKTDGSSGDAFVSGALFCMLNDKKPIQPRMPVSHRSGRNGEEFGMYETAASNGLNIQKGTLDFDVMSLRAELFSERVQVLDFSKMQSDEYNPETGTLCVMFWKSEIDPADQPAVDANEPAQKVAPPHSFDEMMMMEMPQLGSTSPQKSLDQQRQYFRQMARIRKEVPSISFIQINADPQKQAQKVSAVEQNEERMGRELLDGTYVPLFFAGEIPDLSASAVLAANGPLMLVVAPGGKLQYAGPADGFMPAFIVTKLTGVAIDLQALNQTPQASMSPSMPGINGQKQPSQTMDPMYFEMMEMGMKPPVKPQEKPKPAVDPNTIADPNVPAVKPAAVQRPQKAEPDSFEQAQDDMTAQKLLQEAEMQIETCRKLPSLKKAEKGVAACKEVLEKYPGTEHAERAKELLKRVPQGYWDKFEIAKLLGY